MVRSRRFLAEDLAVHTRLLSLTAFCANRCSIGSAMDTPSRPLSDIANELADETDHVRITGLIEDMNRALEEQSLPSDSAT